MESPNQHFEFPFREQIKVSDIKNRFIINREHFLSITDQVFQDTHYIFNINERSLIAAYLHHGSIWLEISIKDIIIYQALMLELVLCCLVSIAWHRTDQMIG